MVLSRLCEVLVVKGMVKVDGEMNCTMKNNGFTVKDIGGVFPGMWYGLIEISCNGCEGQALSKFEGCLNCGMFCEHDRSFTECYHIKSVIGFGLLLGLLLSLGFLLLLYTMITRGRFISKLSSIIGDKKEKTLRQKRDKEILKTIILDKINSGNGNKITEGESEEKMIIEEECGLGGIDLSKVHFVSRGPPRSLGFGITSPALLMTVVLCLGSVTACDRAFILTSQNRFCIDKECNDRPTSFLNLIKGEVVCFETKEGIIKLELLTTRVLHSYKPIFKTSSFLIKTKYKVNCKGVGNCWNPETSEGCHGINRTISGLPKPESEIFSYYCTSSGIGCDTMCWHKLNCISMIWSLVPIGEKYTVFSRSYRLKEYILELSEGNRSTKLIVNSADTFSDLGMPIRVQGSAHLFKELPSKAIILDRKTAHFLESSELNQPIANTLGDLQISTGNEERMTYPIDTIKCHTNGCEGMCIAPKPFVDTLISIKDSITSLKYSYKGENIETIEYSNEAVNVMIIDKLIEGILVSKAECDFVVIDTIACSGCNTNPRIIIKAINIKNSGLLTFKSNCSFDRTSLPCSSVMTEIIMTEEHNYCDVSYGVNKTLFIKPDYKFNGDIISISQALGTSENMWSGLASTVTDYNFYTPFFGSFILTALVVSLSRIIAYFIGYKIAKKETEARTGEI